MFRECTHHNQINHNVLPKSFGCAECIAQGDTWVGLRMCMTCGHMGCCDSSKNKHASAHFSETDHPIIKSANAGESWLWCYVDETYLQ